MITHGEDVEIHALRKQGWSISAIARHLGLDRKTVRAYLGGGREAGVRRSSSVDPFEEIEAYVRRRLSEDPLCGRLGYSQRCGRWAMGRRIRRSCDASGTVGCGRSAGRARRGGRMSTSGTRRVRRSSGTGWSCARPPWGRRALVLVGVLWHSGKLRCWFSESMDRPHLVWGIHQVLVCLGGTSRSWRTDRMATVVAPGTDRVQASFAAVAKHYGAAVGVCPPRRPRRKGAAEKGIDYLTQSWWRTAKVGSPEAVQASADRWCVEVADARVRRV